MGTDINIITEVKKQGKWIQSAAKIFCTSGYDSDSPFDWRSYSNFSFLADVRQNEKEKIKPIFEPKGLPKDSETLNEKVKEPYELNYGYGIRGWCETVGDEINNDIDNHSHSYITLKELIDFDYSQPATDTETYREYLMEGFFEEIEMMKNLGPPDNVRIIIWFD